MQLKEFGGESGRNFAETVKRKSLTNITYLWARWPGKFEAAVRLLAAICVLAFIALVSMDE